MLLIPAFKRHRQVDLWGCSGLQSVFRIGRAIQREKPYLEKPKQTKTKLNLGLVAHAFNPRIQEAEAGVPLWVSIVSFRTGRATQLGPCLKKKQKNKKQRLKYFFFMCVFCLYVVCMCTHMHTWCSRGQQRI